MSDLSSVLKDLSQKVHKTAKDKGFWPADELTPQQVADKVVEIWEEEGSPPLGETEEIRQLVVDIVTIARNTAPPNIGEKAMLMVCEIAEMVETYREGDPESEKLPGMKHSEEEMADLFIRGVDFAGHENMRLGEAIEQKIRYNETRPYKHGRKF